MEVAPRVHGSMVEERIVPLFPRFVDASYHGYPVASPLPGGVMLLTKKLHSGPAGGRQRLCLLNRDALADIYGPRLTTFELEDARVRGAGAILRAFRGEIDGLTHSVLEAAVEHARTARVRTVFVDGSNLGAFVKTVKRRLPHIEVCTFFHNVEARFFIGALRHARSASAAGVLAANYLAERKSVLMSDKIIALSETDRRLLRRLYGRAATHVAPMAVRDEFAGPAPSMHVQTPETFALFVGGAFYANLEGIRWFVRHVVPRISITICIVGRGFEEFTAELQGGSRVEVVGAVKSLSEWYRQARFVIAPIFDGSGMKTKVAEALMFGKRIVATPDAFAGYEGVAGRAGWTCRSADDFVEAINTAVNSIASPFDPDLRAMYEARYSYEAHRQRLQSILSDES